MQVKDIEIPDNKILIDVDINQIILDNGKVVTDPVGELSSSFTVNAQVILAEKEYIRKLSNIFKKAGIEIDGIIPITLAERNLVLDKNELNDNIMLLDVGAENTDMGIFDGNVFKYTDTIPLGRRQYNKRYSTCFKYYRRRSRKIKKAVWFSFKIFYR